MANEVLQKAGTLLVWAHDADYVPAMDYELDLTSLADGAARQGVKGDLGALRAAQYRMEVWVEMDVAPASGATVDIYWAASRSATAGTNNPAGTTGADAAYTGTAGDSLDDSLKQLVFIGSVVLTSDDAPVVQRMVFTFVPPLRYGMPVVDNNSGQAFEGDAEEMAIKVIPIIDEIQ
jgi:hypothetical protein